MGHSFTSSLFHCVFINSQVEHHRKQTFQEEFLAFLKKHNMEYDERYIWD